MQITSTCHIPGCIFHPPVLSEWPPDLYVIPEYSFSFRCPDKIILSHEHTECVWLTPTEAKKKLMWDSNRTALHEPEFHRAKRDFTRLWGGFHYIHRR